MHQNKTNTGINRYPEIFKFTYDSRHKNNMNILSFGCSSGDEIISLSMFFGESIIYGTEIDIDMLETCRLRFKYVDRIKVGKIIPNIKFDMIFCMSVFCMWPDTERISDCSGIYSFDKFETGIIDIDSHLNIGGMLVIYNCNFLFSETSIYKKYKSIGSFESSGFVHKFNRNNLKIDNNYHECVFIKIY